MPGFQDQIAADLAAFVNPAEMGEMAAIAGHTIPAVIEEWRGQPEGDPGVNLSEMVVRVRAADLPEPKVGREITINGDVWLVRGIEKEMGLLTLRLFRNEA